MSLRKLKFWLFVPAFFLALNTSPAFADFDLHVNVSTMTGNEFYSRCRDGDDINILWCLGYVNGISDGLAIMQFSPGGPPDGFTPICIPQSVNVGQKKDVILDYLAKNPADRHEIISLHAITAWRYAWPCS